MTLPALPNEAACPRCLAQVKPHRSTGRIPNHPTGGRRGADRCSFSNDYLPGYAPEKPIKPIRRKIE